MLSVQFDLEPLAAEMAGREEQLPGDIINERRGQARWSGGGASASHFSNSPSTVPMISFLGVVIVIVFIVNYVYKNKKSRRSKRPAKPRSINYTTIKAEQT